MKKISLIIVLILNGTLLFSQEIPKDIKEGNGSGGTKTKGFNQPTLIAIYDYEKQIYINDELKPKHKQPVVLKIVNINKLANNVEITTSDLRIKDEFLEGDIQEAKSIIADNKPVDEIKREALNIDLKIPEKIEDDSKKKIEKNNDLILKLSDKIKKIEKQITAIQLDTLIISQTVFSNLIKIKELKEKIVTESNVDILKLDDSYVQKIIENTDFYKSQIENLELINTTLNNKIKTSKIELSGLLKDKKEFENELNVHNNTSKAFKEKTSELIDEYLNLYSNLIAINKINAAYNNFIIYLSNPKLTLKQYRDSSKSICAILKSDKDGTKKIDEYYSIVTGFDESYIGFIKKYTDLFNNNLFYEIVIADKDYANLIKLKFDVIKNDVEALNKLVNTQQLREKLNNVEILDNVFRDENSYTVVSNPIQPFEDYLEFKVKVTQNKELGKSILKETPKEFTYTEYVRQGVRWDFSVGTVFDFGIKNQEFEIKKNETNSKYQIIENTSTEYTPTIAGLLHTSFRSNNMFAFGLSLGASIDLTKLNFNSFFPGVSLLIGKREKLVFTVGPAFKRVNQLKAIYDINTDYTEQLQTENVTSLQFKTGWFVGMSWNLTNKQKSKIIPQK